MSSSFIAPPCGTDFPRRIVCLTDETSEVLYLIGAEDRIVGVSGYASHPPQVRNKPRVAAFRDADFEAILALKPDLVLTFSDVQAEITRQLVLRGLTVFNFNQRSIAEILEMIATLSRLVGKEKEGFHLIGELRHGLDELADSAKAFPRRPRVFFEEWNDPLISGIRWVEELVEIAGGEVLFPELRACRKAAERIVDPATVAARDPEVILAAWCGKKMDRQLIEARPGWAETSAVRCGHIYEIPSGCILQPGPASLTEGARQIHAIFRLALGMQGAPVSPQKFGHLPPVKF